MSDTDLEALARGLTNAQRHFIIMSSETPMHPYDIDANGLTAKAMVSRGLAFRTLCTSLSDRDSFNGYGLTPLGIQLRGALRARLRPPAQVVGGEG